MSNIIVFFVFIIQVISSNEHFSLGSLSTITCDKYLCGRVPGSYCLGRGENSIYTSKCPTDTFCSKEGQCHAIHEKYLDGVSFPGESCSAEKPCKNSQCINNTCRGKSLGETCEDSSECEPGFRCHHTCKALFLPGERGCLEDFDCSMDSACNYGQCYKYFSLTIGDKVEKCENFSNILCDSAMCDKGKCIRDQNLLEFPKECTKDQDCKSADGYFTSCMCGINTEGTSYCVNFPGDDVGREYFILLNRWLRSKNIEKCNTKRRFAMNCMYSHWPSCYVAEYIYRVYRYMRFPVIINNPECVEQSLTQDYWRIREVFLTGGKNNQCKLSF